MLISTVRTHLSALVNHNIVPPDRPCEASGGLSKEVWSKYQKDCKVGLYQRRVCVCVYKLDSLTASRKPTDLRHPQTAGCGTGDKPRLPRVSE